jgi:hypothetical protein
MQFDKNLSGNLKENIWNLFVISIRYNNVRVIIDK